MHAPTSRSWLLAVALASATFPREAFAQSNDTCIPASVTEALACHPTAPAPPQPTPPAFSATYAPSPVLAWEVLSLDARVTGVSDAQLQSIANTDPLYPQAQYVLAASLWLAGQHSDALRSLQNVVSSLRQHPSWPSANALDSAALRAWAIVTASNTTTFDATEAVRSLQAFTDRPSQVETSLEELARAYAQRGANEAAANAWRWLLDHRPVNEQQCRAQYELARASHRARLPSARADLLRLIDLQQEWTTNANAHPLAQREGCSSLAASLVFQLAVAEQQGFTELTAPQRQGTTQQQMRQSAELFALLLERFPALDAMRFPDLPAVSWPRRHRVAWLRANVLRGAGNYSECGIAFDQLAAMNPPGEYTAPSRYLSVLCNNDYALSIQSRDRSRRRMSINTTPEEFSARETLLLRSFERFLCSAEASSPPNTEDDPRTVQLTIQYRRAYLYYQRFHFEEAAALFRAIALGDASVPDPENLREIAADLYLDSLHLLATRLPSGPRPVCSTELSRAVDPLRNRFCVPNTLRDQHLDFCERTQTLQCQLLRTRAEALVANHQYSEAGQAYVSIVRAHPDCPRVDETLYNAAIAYDAAHDLRRSLRLRSILVETFLPSGNPLALRSAYQLGANYEALAVYTSAADAYERFVQYVARSSSQANAEVIESAIRAWQRAIQLRVALGESSGALDSSRAFVAWLQTIQGNQQARTDAQLGLGELLLQEAEHFDLPASAPAVQQRAQRSAWNAVRTHYTQTRTMLGTAVTAEQQRTINEAIELAARRLRGDRSTTATTTPAPPEELFSSQPRSFDRLVSSPPDYDARSLREESSANTSAEEEPPLRLTPPPPPSAGAGRLRLRPTVSPIIRPSPVEVRPRGAYSFSFNTEAVTASTPASMPPVPFAGVSALSVRSAILERLGQVRSCYTAALLLNPSAHGELTVRFVFMQNGTVPTVALMSTNQVGLDRATACILSVPRSLNLSVGDAEAIITVDYPFAFSR